MTTEAAPAWKTSNTTLTVTPNPAISDGYFRFTGCGFDNTTVVTLSIKRDGQEVRTYGTGVWFDGCISGRGVTDDPGSYTLEAYQTTKKGKDKILLKATTTFVVE